MPPMNRSRAPAQTIRQDEWRSEMCAPASVQGRGQMIHFSVSNRFSALVWLHADAETRPNDEASPSCARARQKTGNAPSFPSPGTRAVGNQKQVEMALERSAQARAPSALIVFARVSI